MVYKFKIQAVLNGKEFIKELPILDISDSEDEDIKKEQREIYFKKIDYLIDYMKKSAKETN